MVMPLTVLMAVWNSPVHELELAIHSILGQTFRDFEFLIIDDGSNSPATVAYLDRRAGEDVRIRVVREPHRGLTASLNRGLELARGRLIARQDADDWSAPSRLEKQIQYFAQHPNAILCGTDAWTHQQNGFRLWRTGLPGTSVEILTALENGNPFVHGSTMFRKDAALAVGGYANELTCSQDYDFFWRLAELGDVANLPQPLYHYRYSAGSVSAGKAEDQALAHRAAKILARSRRNHTPCSPLQALADARLEIEREGRAHQALLKQADHLMLAGSYLRAWRAYLNVLRQHPASSLVWAKLMRLGVFVAIPGIREACFR